MTRPFFTRSSATHSRGCAATDTALGYQMMRNLALDLAFKLRHPNLDE